jgi:predicted HAD superfamily Cof-like phosphohydrolase
METNFDKVKKFMDTAGQTQQTFDLRNDSLCNFRVSLVEEEFNEFKKAVIEKNREEVLDGIMDMLVTVYGSAVAFGLTKENMEKCFDIVHESNMSKFCKTQKEAEDTVSFYENHKLYDSPSYRFNPESGLWVVYNTSTGKILKSVNYTPANLKNY